MKNYVMRINFNRSTNIRTIPLIQVTILLVVSSIVAFVLSVYRGLIGPVPVPLILVSIGLVVGVVVVSGLVTQVRRAIRDVREWR